MLEEWRRRRAAKKVKPGDGKPLKPMRAWHALSRTVFHIDLPDDDGASRTFSVDVPFFNLDGRVSLYLDGQREAWAEAPAVFPVPGGVIEVKTSTYGVARMHFVPDVGEERQLLPDRASAEAARARFDARHPVASRVIGAVAVVVLLAGLVLGLPQFLEQLSELTWVAENIGTFTSPFALPAWLNTALFVAGLVAALERALTLRNHWLIDMDTWFLGD